MTLLGRCAWALAACLVLTGQTALADTIMVRITLSTQEMAVSRDGDALFRWQVSTARAGKCTPIGTFQPEWMTPYHRSTLYDGAPMPWSIFFHGNYAIHGTTQIERLGAPASAGCIRLAPDNAETLYKLVLEVGKAQTWIVVEE